MNEDIFYMCRDYAIRFLTSEIKLLNNALESEKTGENQKPILEDTLKKYERDLNNIRRGHI